MTDKIMKINAINCMALVDVGTGAPIGFVAVGCIPVTGKYAEIMKLDMIVVIKVTDRGLF